MRWKLCLTDGGKNLRAVFCHAARLMLTLAAVACLGSGWVNAQQDAPLGGSAPPVNRGGLEGDHVRDALMVNPQMQEQMENRRNSDRQKQLVADTEKLFQLAQQLRDEVAKSNKDQLSVPVVKKSEEIEKLARSVKERMRGY